MRSSAQKRVIFLVFDENISGPSILEPLKLAGLPVKAQTEIMKRGIPDEEVLLHLAKHPGHYLLSHDSDFYRHTGTLAVLKQHKVGAFILTGLRNKNADAITETIRKSWPQIKSFVQAHNPPFAAKIVQGKAEQVV